MTPGVIFLDRDGVINVEAGYLTRPEDLELLPGAIDAVAALCEAGWTVFVYTNQSGVGRGYLTVEALDTIHDHLRSEVASVGGRLSGIYACTHGPNDGCDCRKPKPGLLLQAAREHDLDLAGAFAVGDSPRDIAAAHAAGCRTVLVLTGHTSSYDPAAFPDPQPDQVFPTLAIFTRWLLAQAL